MIDLLANMWRIFILSFVIVFAVELASSCISPTPPHRRADHAGS
jgi:hypothetical protein